MRIAASVTLLFSPSRLPTRLLPVVSRRALAKNSSTNSSSCPLWVSYLVRGYAWKTILGSDGVLNGFLQYLHITTRLSASFSTAPSPSS